MIRASAAAFAAILASTLVAGAVEPAPPVAAPSATEPPAELDASSPLPPPGEEAIPSAATGKAFLRESCAGCHAIGASGDSPETSAPPFRVLVQRYEPEALEEALAEGIVTGHPEMPQAALDPTAIADVIAYLDALKLVTEP